MSSLDEMGRRRAVGDGEEETVGDDKAYSD